MPTYYEWRVEECTADDYEDADDLWFCDTYADAVEHQQSKTLDGYKRCICLNRRKFDPITEDLIDEQWAFIEDGKLPEFFDDCPETKAYKVPAKFHKEVADFSK